MKSGFVAIEPLPAPCFDHHLPGGFQNPLGAGLAPELPIEFTVIALAAPQDSGLHLPRHGTNHTINTLRNRSSATGESNASDSNNSRSETDFRAVAFRSSAVIGVGLLCIDPNMVRAGTVKHPAQWLGVDLSQLAAHRQWVEEALRRDEQQREPFWSESAQRVGGNSSRAYSVSSESADATATSPRSKMFTSYARPPQPYGGHLVGEMLPLSLNSSDLQG